MLGRVVSLLGHLAWRRRISPAAARATPAKLFPGRENDAGPKHATVRDALKDVDESGDGTLTRDEVKLFLKEQYLLKFRDFYTNQIRGELEEVVVDTLLDFVDQNGDGSIKYDEFSAVVMAGAN